MVMLIRWDASNMEIVFHGGICLDEHVRKFFFGGPSDDRRCPLKMLQGHLVSKWAPGPFRGNDCSYVYAVAAAFFILGALNPLPNMDLLVSPGNQDGSFWELLQRGWME